jgi:hypothetical protein
MPRCSRARGQLRALPLAQASAPPTTAFTDVQDIDFDSTIRYDATFFDNLNRVVQEEPWLERDRAMIDPLRTLGIKRLGAGQFYMISIKDEDGDSYDGSKTYRLSVPPNAPVEQCWSLTAYDRETHALIKNVGGASRASNGTEVVKNADGSVDLYVGPVAPAGKDAHWIPTDPDRRFELMVRFYGPTRALFDKAWKLPDVTKA